jgi:HEAT repeat protein
MVKTELDQYIALLYSEHGHDRQAAIAWFCEHPEASRPVLRSFFQPLEDEWAAEAALEALACIAHPEDVALLDSVLASGKLAFKAGFALAKNPSPAAYQALMRRSTEENEAVARGAIGGLGERRDQQARPHLESLLSHANPNIRWAAVLALDDLGAKPSEKALRECAKVETDKDVKGKIREVLR